ncbi:MAG TPA: hypothetical protein VFW78_07935 [Bacteroidia bacterium]|nr:hypothetical protein [Bacteroidia bacterium]
MKQISVVLFICLTATGFVQPVFAQQGNQWMLGWIGKADFTGGSMQYISYPDTAHLAQTSAGICDSSGQILFWTNGSEFFRAIRSVIGSVPHLPFSQSYVQTGLGLNQLTIYCSNFSDGIYLYHVVINNTIKARDKLNINKE